MTDTNTTAEDRRAKIMGKVQAMLAKAESTTYGPERDAFIAKADQLMAAYAIEAFELEFARPAQERRQPSLKKFDYGNTGEWKADRMMYQMFVPLADLCRCKVGTYGYHDAQVVGYPEDLEYLELLWTNIRLTLAANVEPRPDPNKEIGENVAILKEAGMKWDRICGLLGVPFVKDGPDVRRLFSQYKEFCKRTGRKTVGSNPNLYRESFIEGFTDQLRDRIREMKYAQGESAGAAGKGLVLAGLEDALLEELYKHFPHLRPHPKDCDCDARCHVKKCVDPNCARTDSCIYRNCRDRANCKHAICKEMRKPVRYSAARERSIDHAGRQAGRGAANKADLSGGRRNVGNGPKGEIGG